MTRATLISGHQRPGTNVDRPSRLPRRRRLAAAERRGTADATNCRGDAVGQHAASQEDFPQQDADGGHGKEHRAVSLLPLREEGVRRHSASARFSVRKAVSAHQRAERQQGKAVSFNCILLVCSPFREGAPTAYF